MTEDEKTEALRALCDDPEAREILSQLWNGLIHPLEYARQIVILADKYNLTLLD